MSDTNKTLSECDCYRLGRLVFDAADAKWIAVREKIPKKQGQLVGIPPVKRTRLRCVLRLVQTPPD